MEYENENPLFTFRLFVSFPYVAFHLFSFSFSFVVICYRFIFLSFSHIHFKNSDKQLWLQKKSIKWNWKTELYKMQHSVQNYMYKYINFFLSFFIFGFFFTFCFPRFHLRCSFICVLLFYFLLQKSERAKRYKRENFIWEYFSCFFFYYFYFILLLCSCVAFAIESRETILISNKNNNKQSCVCLLYGLFCNI